jgi:uncharacterized protein with ACT and thioredoxin-like domain
MSYDFKIENGDWQISSSGDIEKVEDENKLIQDILKICISKRGSNKNAPYYGTVLGDIVGSIPDRQFTETYATNQLQDALKILQKLQQLQETTQFVSLKESLAAVKEARVVQSLTDPRFYGVRIKVLNKSFSEVQTGFDINQSAINK